MPARHRSNRCFMSWLLPVVLLLLLCIPTAQAQDSVSLTLENGMRIVLQQNRANPLIASVVAVRAGSRHEEIANNGVSHLLEHLLFSGTPLRSRKEIAEEIRRRSGYLNAFTRKDATSYVLLVPKMFAEEALEIQADMLFSSLVPEDELAKERKVVIEEINQNMDNPDYRAELFFDRMVYGGSRYARPVLGFKNLIANLSRQDILDFYRRHYAPNNMVALVTGDFEVDEMEEIVKRVFGPYPSRDLSSSTLVDPPLQTPDRIYYRRLPVPQTSLTLAFRGPSFDDPDYHAFDLLTRLLVLHDSSPLNQAFKGEGAPKVLGLSSNLVLQEGGSSYVLRLALGSPEPPSAKASEASDGEVGSEAAPGLGAIRRQAQDVVHRVIGVLQGMVDRRLVRQEVLQVLTGLKAEEYRLREKLHYWGMAKAPLLALAGYEFVWSYPEKMEQVGPDALVRTAKRFFSQPRYVGTVAYPPEVGLEGEAEGEKGDAASVRPDKESLQREVLPNGLTVIARRNPATRVFAVHVLAKNRPVLEPPGKEGAVDLLSRVLFKGTLTRSAGQMAQALADIGAEVKSVDDPRIPYDDVYTSPAYAFIRLETIAEHAEAGLDLLADALRHPSLPPEAIDRAREDMRRAIARRQRNPSQTARRILYSELFKGSSFGREDPLGTPESIEAVSRADLQELHRRLYAPNNLIVALVGDLSPREMVAMVSRRFGDLKRGESPSFRAPDLGRQKGRRVAKALDSEQASIRLALPLAGVESPDAPAMRLLASVLSSRLTDRLREAQGLAYAVKATAHLLPGFGWLEISVGTAPANVSAAREGILREMQGLRDAPIGKEELENARNSHWGSLLMNRLSSINQAYYACLYELWGMPADFEPGELSALTRVEPEEVQRIARKVLDVERAVIAVVGGEDKE